MEHPQPVETTPEGAPDPLSIHDLPPSDRLRHELLCRLIVEVRGLRERVLDRLLSKELRGGSFDELAAILRLIPTDKQQSEGQQPESPKDRR